MGRDSDDIDGFDEPSARAGADSPAPLPPHERVWRHPSEVGFATVTSVDAAPINIGRTGRSLIGVISVAGVLLSIALVLALQPDSLHSDAHDVVALTNSRLRVASFVHTRPNPDREPDPAPNSSMKSDPGHVEIPRLSIGARLVDTFRSVNASVSAVTRPAQVVATTTTIPVPAAAPTRAMGVLSESGNHLLTTMAAVEGIESIDVRLPNGDMVRGRVLHTLPELRIAVLSISDESTTGGRADIKASGLGTDGADYQPGQSVVVLTETPFEFVVGQPLDDIIVALDSFATLTLDHSIVPEGAPLVSKAGHLIGLCTHAGGRLGFVPVSLLESALADLLTVDDGDGGATTTLPTQ